MIDHQRLAWTTTTSQQQCYQNYSSYYTNMDYLSPTTHQLNVVVSMNFEPCRFRGDNEFPVILKHYHPRSLSTRITLTFVCRTEEAAGWTIRGAKRGMKALRPGSTTAPVGAIESECRNRSSVQAARATIHIIDNS